MSNLQSSLKVKGIKCEEHEIKIIPELTLASDTRKCGTKLLR